MNNLAIGVFLTELRKYYKLTQEDLAAKLSVSRQAISRWETGQSLPDIETFMELSKLYGITINEIIDANLSAIKHKKEQITAIDCNNKKNICVIGCGRWGSFISWYLDKIGHNVTLYGRDSSLNMTELKKNRKNGYLELPESICLTTKLDNVVNSNIIIISIGAQHLQNLMDSLQEYNLKNKIIVLCMKGIEISSGRRLSQIVDDNLDLSNCTAVWLGPGHVEEFYNGIPNCMVIDSSDELVKNELVNIFSSKLIRFYYGMDIVGNEIGAAAKNIIGIAAGMLDALNRSTLKGALMSRAPREIAKLVKAMGGNELTAYGLCHLGDYEATLFSEHSHNRQFGENFILNKPYDKLAEGYYTVKAFINLGKNHGIDLPICKTVYNILYHQKDALSELDYLFGRSLKEEFL